MQNNPYGHEDSRSTRRAYQATTNLVFLAKSGRFCEGGLIVGRMALKIRSQNVPRL